MFSLIEKCFNLSEFFHRVRVREWVKKLLSGWLVVSQSQSRSEAGSDNIFIDNQKDLQVEEHHCDISSGITAFK